ncbi:unnamed protein product [Hydatigera taeniaeformis]|uniref:Uncharacterized protein n=1 Tax=Hydatigena taeniaeformis TaxID=6205 RepID=A0A0R3X4G3_HYDTA|nr:unnamed protein product [Hydatigera taeniaeformis]
MHGLEAKPLHRGRKVESVASCNAPPVSKDLPHQVSQWVAGRPALQAVVATSTTIEVVERLAIGLLWAADLLPSLRHIMAPLLSRLVTSTLLLHCMTAVTVQCHLQQPPPSTRAEKVQTSVMATTEPSFPLKTSLPHQRCIFKLNFYFRFIFYTKTAIQRQLLCDISGRVVMSYSSLAKRRGPALRLTLDSIFCLTCQ